jgi:hypothetical protein
MKMPITGHQGELILHGNRGNPDIVFGNRSALGTQRVFDVPVLLGGGRVAWEHCIAYDKFINAGEILCDMCGLTCSIIEFAKDNAGDKHFADLCQTLLYRCLSREKRNHDICIEQKSTSPRHALVPLLRHAQTLARDVVVQGITDASIHRFLSPVSEQA